MKSVDYAQAQEYFDEILAEAQRQPIVISRHGRDTAVLLSIFDYEQLRLGAVREFLALRDAMAREASASGLTEARLPELLQGD